MIDKTTFERLRALARSHYERAIKEHEDSAAKVADLTLEWVKIDEDIDGLEAIYELEL
ncbi:MAG: hypothetical protein V4458_06235 [Pseudomonadota bacterium]